MSEDGGAFPVGVVRDAEREGVGVAEGEHAIAMTIVVTNRTIAGVLLRGRRRQMLRLKRRTPESSISSISRSSGSHLGRTTRSELVFAPPESLAAPAGREGA
jgi:hypothetical protein